MWNQIDLRNITQTIQFLHHSIRIVCGMWLFETKIIFREIARFFSIKFQFHWILCFTCGSDMNVMFLVCLFVYDDALQILTIEFSWVGQMTKYNTIPFQQQQF